MYNEENVTSEVLVKRVDELLLLQPFERRPGREQRERASASVREVSIKRSRIALVKGLKRELPTRRPFARHLVVRASAGPSGEIKVFLESMRVKFFT